MNSFKNLLFAFSLCAFFGAWGMNNDNNNGYEYHVYDDEGEHLGKVKMTEPNNLASLLAKKNKKIKKEKAFRPRYKFFECYAKHMDSWLNERPKYNPKSNIKIENEDSKIKNNTLVAWDELAVSTQAAFGKWNIDRDALCEGILLSSENDDLIKVQTKDYIFTFALQSDGFFQIRNCVNHLPEASGVIVNTLAKSDLGIKGTVKTMKKKLDIGARSYKQNRFVLYRDGYQGSKNEVLDESFKNFHSKLVSL